MELPRHAALFYAGFVPEEQKLALMAQAAVLIMPSPMESLSIVTLEALGQGTPVLANAGSAVLQEHVLRSGAGRLYHDGPGFARHLQELCSPAGGTDSPVDSRAQRAAAGRLYVQRNYSHEQVQQRVVAAVRAVSG
jgi:glycosyltransferase involved in cell wall biosynthesis